MFAKKMTHIVFLASMLMTRSVYAAVILQYHHVSEKLPAVTSVSSDTFTAHLQYLKENNFKVVPLNTLLHKLKHGLAVGPNTVAITFDDGYDNNITDAAPLLEKFNYPYTIFVNPKLIDEQQSYVMTWDELRTLAKRGALIANHSAQHDYLHKKLTGETHDVWYTRIKQDITWSEQRIKEEVGHNAKLLAYPYGEFNTALQQLVAELGYIGIGQHSGAVGMYSDFTRIPRFPASGIYADLNTLKTKLHSNAFSIAAAQYDNSVTSQSKPVITLTFHNKPFHTSQLACFISGGGTAELTWLNDKSVSITSSHALTLGRSRYNCTAPIKGKPGQYYWYSQPWVIIKSHRDN
ncbi:polysaccharide deacetylase family protein [Pseudoalteromonas sp. MMG013]|uniref:polysaccharide deacetylase family protein n=1 Tax=Pseudoalteromonas sp. MMG013 TaxID=2822687 RepID=UPI001B39A426|nr:polysaccharide deacetylase family protein [Pseudoalteromonas sp. MMG013]MBQ4863823.1 polysaccharide deacetylase family protein [Pseudoalteromonas sp. MMG013]